jgi:prepilin-type N-terminal cleavage/methylation domain-containing protein
MSQKGFTLVELLVVILILGILAAIAAPKLLDTSGEATDNGLRQTLSVVRDAIERFSVNNGGKLPGADGSPLTFKKNLARYLRGPFPKAPVGPAQGDNRVRMIGDGVQLTGRANPVRAWRYDYTTGEFIFNYSGTSSDGVTRYDEF